MWRSIIGCIITHKEKHNLNKNLQRTDDEKMRGRKSSKIADKMHQRASDIQSNNYYYRWSKAIERNWADTLQQCVNRPLLRFWSVEVRRSKGGERWKERVKRWLVFLMTAIAAAEFLVQCVPPEFLKLTVRNILICLKRLNSCFRSGSGLAHVSALV